LWTCGLVDYRTLRLSVSGLLDSWDSCVSRTFGLLDTWTLGLLDSLKLGSWILGLVDLWTLGLSDSLFLGFWTLGHSDSHTLGLSESQCIRFSNSLNLGFSDSWNV
jgi:hypothetical protein